MKFGGKKIWVHVPDNAVCEVSRKILPRKHLEEGMRLELSELDVFGVATIIGEAEARKRATRRIHTTRWVLTSKPSATNPERVRARLVVRDYAFGSNPLADGIYSPTTSLEALAKYEPVARDLALGSVPLLVIEVFCSADSALCRACARDRVAYIGITEEEDFLSKSTQLFLGEVLLCLLSRKPPQIYVHIASPCTAGCSYRFKHWHRPKFRHRWREQVKKHVASWKALGKLLEDRCKEILMTQEWPKNCSLWKEESYLKDKKRLGLNFGRVVDRCAFDGVFKRWFFATNREEWSEIFSGKPCDKSHQHVSLASV